MALTLSRWTIFAALTCAVVGVVLLPVTPREFGRRFVPGQSTRLQRVSGQLDRARETLRIVQLGEAAIELSRRTPLPAGGEPALLEIGAATPEQREAFRSKVKEWWPKTGLDNSVPVALVLGGDSANATWLAHHMLPTSGDGRTCVTLVPTQTWAMPTGATHRRTFEHRLANELGPCLFMALYGRPGGQIEQWLNGRGLDFATYFNPAGRPNPEIDDPEDDLPVEYGVFDFEWALYGRMPLGIPCLTGDFERCASAVAPRDTGTRVARPGFRAQNVSWRTTFGPLTSSFLADLHREIGPEKFRDFWRSSEPVDEAIRRATGVSLGEWTYRWAVGHSAEFRPGPMPKRRSVVRVAGLTVLLLGLAMGYSVRRKVS